MFVQLILTIGKARTFNRYNPPPFLCAFDYEKIAIFLFFMAFLSFFAHLAHALKSCAHALNFIGGRHWGGEFASKRGEKALLCW
jgi:hypothetical protein